MTFPPTTRTARLPAPNGAAGEHVPSGGRTPGMLAGMGGFILLLHMLGWGTLMLVTSGYRGGTTLTLGVGVTAYTLGMRHAFDADHIAAIDNTTRKLSTERTRPLSVGFWFSLGHSSVVFVLAVALSVGLRRMVGQIRDSDSALHHYTGIVGASVSGLFLYAVAAMNLAALVALIRLSHRANTADGIDPEEMEAHLQRRGLLNRMLSRFTRTIRAPWQMYPLGVLFGLGFDTATEVALLVLAATATASGVAWYGLLCLPVLFAAGMCLLDTVDGVLMSGAYRWAADRPGRRLSYNLIVTGLSIALAAGIGTVELVPVLAEQCGWHGRFFGWLDGLDMTMLGYVIVGLFAVVWLGAVALFRWRQPCDGCAEPAMRDGSRPGQ